MAARFTGSFYSSYTAQQYTVVLYDDEFVGSPTIVDIAACDYNYPSGNAGRFDTILAAELSVKLFVNASGLDTFVEELAGASEGRFMLQLLAGITPEFIGYILPDLAQQEDTTLEVGYLLEMRATDGLARLKTIDYNNAGVVYSGEETITGHILNCLNALPSFADFYTTTPILKTRVNWHSDQHTYTVGVEDPLELTRIPHRAFYSIDTKGNYKYKSCFDVLSEICRAWGARMVYSDYAFWFVQYNEMATDAAMTVFTYTKTGTQASESVDFRKDHDQTDADSELVRLSGGVFRFFPPLMKTQVDYRHIATRNLLAGQVLSNVSSTDINAGPVDDQNQDGNMIISFRMQHRIDNYNTPPGDVPVWLLFLVKVQVGDLYLSRLATISGGGVTYEGATWINNSSARYRIALLNYGGGFDVYDNILFYTGSLLDSGDFIFGISLGGQFLEDGTEILTGGGAGDIVWNADVLNATHLYTGTISGQADIRRFVSTNNTAGNSAMTEIVTIIGDGIGTNSPGHLESYDGADWVLSEGWRVGASGTYLAHSALLAQEVIRGQLTPIRRFQGTYNNNTAIYKPHHVIKRSDGIMMFAGGRFVPGIDSIDGEWYFISPQSSGWTNEPFEDIPADQSSNAGRPSGGGGGSGGGTTTPVRIYSQHFDTVTANTVTVTVNSGTLPTNADALLVFWNGQLITSAFYTVTGSDIEFSFDVTDNVTVKFFIQ